MAESKASIRVRPSPDHCHYAGVAMTREHDHMAGDQNVRPEPSKSKAITALLVPGILIGVWGNAAES
jgi:hypothetical protein